MQPPKDFTNKVDAPSSIVEYFTNISSSGVESHHLRHHEADEEDAEPRRGCQSTLGPDAGILEVPDAQYRCINDSVVHGGMCTSGEKVYQARAKCSKCIVSDFPV